MKEKQYSAILTISHLVLVESMGHRIGTADGTGRQTLAYSFADDEAGTRDAIDTRDLTNPRDRVDDPNITDATTRLM
jgi:hypothetical protein